MTENSPPDWLILVPTRLELNLLRSYAEFDLIGGNRIEVCGFGPIVSAARTASLIAELRPKRVMLIGIAGGYSESAKTGEAYLYQLTSCFGVGVGSGADFKTAESIEWKHWQEERVEDSIGDTIQLNLGSHSSPIATGSLLTCTSASACEEDVRARRERFPLAEAEDMEGFSVAAACKLQKTELAIIRGISNRAGDRDHSHWQIDSALKSALSLAVEVTKDQSSSQSVDSRSPSS